MKVLLIDADSKIPNLALMKLSTYHKNQGDEVTLIQLNIPYYPNKPKRHFYAPSGYDKYYCSTIFTGSEEYIHGDNIQFGGTGHNLTTVLPSYIESLEPDYSIYPDNDTSYGFITRGCINNCSFCVVPQKEGKIHQVNTIQDIVRHKKVKFMDNNILALPSHKEILQEIVDMKLKCQFNQGLDIRLINEENSILISKMNYLGDYLFAFDNWAYLPIIESKLELMKWRKDYKFKFFLYCHPDMPISNIVNRINYLKEKKCLPYVMRHISCWDSQYSKFYIDIASWCNQPNLFRKMTFKEFLGKRHIDKSRINSSLVLYQNI
jgi:hypothetical protein